MKSLTIREHDDGTFDIQNNGFHDVQILGYLEIFKQQILYDRLKMDNNPLEKAKVKRVPIQEFINRHHVEMSVRLINILRTQERTTDNLVFPFVDTITRAKFYKIRNAGKRSWTSLREFLEADGYEVKTR